jgi:hypothetical protein
VEADGHRVRQGREVHRGEAREQIVGLGAGERIVSAGNAGSWPTAGVSTDSYVVKALAAGTYFLVVDADSAGSEGGVILQLSGLPSS